MELTPPEHALLQTIIKNWVEHPLRECEATFGNVDGTAFLAVAQRLRSKGYTALPQEDRLTIATPEHNRFTLSGMGVIQQYCRDNRIAGKTYVAITKDRASTEPPLTLEEYDTVVKVRNEIPLPDSIQQSVITDWANQKKAFRLIRRWSFEGNGFQFDLSIVYSTFKDKKGNYKWVRNFQDQPIRSSPPTYEIEVEIKRSTENDDPVKAIGALVRGIGEVLRGLQKNTLLIRRSMKLDVLNGYKLLTKEERFRGVAPITLEIKNILEKKESEDTPTLYDGYNVTDKADGLRVHGFTNSKGELFMIDMSMNVYRTGLKKEACKDSLLDGEWITVDKDGKGIQQLLFFDIYIHSKNRVDMKPFYKEGNDDVQTRYKHMNTWVSTWNDKETPVDILVKGLNPSNTLQVSSKQFKFATPGDKSIFQCATAVLKKPQIYNTDGLIFTPNEKPLPERAGVGFLEQFKWKPAHDNTIDFLVSLQKDEGKTKDAEAVLIKEGTGETITYKTLRLFVGSSADPAYTNPRDTILFEKEKPTFTRQGAKRDYKPVLFTPKEFPDTMANICYREVVEDTGTNQLYISTDRSVEPIQDKSIVEMAYDPSQLPGWRWRPVRVRHDKTERFQRGIIGRTLNSDMNAEGVWNSIHQPITISMIQTGSETPSAIETAELAKMDKKEMNVSLRYAERRAPVQDLAIIRGLRDFHNRYIKEDLLLEKGLAGKHKSLVDFAVGKAADIQKWRRNNVGFVFGIDIAGESIQNANDGAYRRYLDTSVNSRGGTLAPMVFAIGDSSKSIASGDAGATEEERDIMRSVYGQIEPSGPVPPHVLKVGKDKLKNGADCAAIMFALHYLFKDELTFNGLLENLRDSVKVGGYFIGCCFDGSAVYSLLKKVKKGDKKVGMESGANIWTLIKQYENENESEVLPNQFGLAVDVEFISIGLAHREYLVPFDLLVEKLKTVGLELLTTKEQKELGLSASTEMFADSYKRAEKEGKRYAMSDIVKQYSFLNRWFIFKRTGSLQRALTETEEIETKTKDAVKPLIQTKQPDMVKNVLVTPSVPVPVPVPVSSTVKDKSGVKATAVPTKTQFDIADIIQFKLDITPNDKLKLGDVNAARWLSPIAPFPITDGDDTYPSMEHYMAAMKYQIATNQPTRAQQLFGSEGTIHQKMLRQQLQKEVGGKKLSENELFELYENEMIEILKEVTPSGFKKNKATYDESVWASNKHDVLMEAIQQRWNKDARFRRVVEAARNQGKYLLYAVTTATSDIGGKYIPKEKKIDGNNLIGKLMMEIAGFPST